MTYTIIFYPEGGDMETITALYKNGEYLKHNKNWHRSDAPWKVDKILKIIRNDIYIKSIAEIGCGSGEILNQLSKQMSNNINFFGYDISPQAIDMCKGKAKKNLNFYCTDFLRLDKIFDLILLIDVLEHIPNYFDFLEKIRDKGKYFIFHIPLEFSVFSIIRPKSLINTRQKIGHINYFCKDTIIATLHETEYEIMDYFYTARSVDLIHNYASKFSKKYIGWLPRYIFNKINIELSSLIFGGTSLMILCKS